MSGNAVSAAAAPPLAVYRLCRSDRDRPPEHRIHTVQAEREWNEPLLRQNAIWFCYLRWIVVATLGIAGLAGLWPEVAKSLELTIRPSLPLGAAAVLAAMNLVFVRLAGRAGSPDHIVAVKLLLWAQIITDLLVLTAVIHWLGSGLPSAPFMYLFHIILACIVFTPGESLMVVGLAAGFYLVCLLLESLGLVGAPSVFSGSVFLDHPLFTERFLAFNVAPMLLIWAVIWYLVSRLAGTLRRRECELALSNLRLQASSEERAQHMLQTTHQLKAPFAAIHAQTQLLLGNYCGALPPAALEVIAKISTRCLALSRQIQEMLQLANLRSQGQTSPPQRSVHLALLLEAAVARIEPAARQRGIELKTAFESITIRAVEDHLTMLFDNLLVNAVNYSYDGGVVEVSCGAPPGKSATVTVRDHGIGIPREKLPKIFDDYYRTNEAVQHNRTSTGLGLAIVRHAAEEVGAAIEVESALGWGSRFTVTFPGGLAEPEKPSPMRKN